MLQLARRGTLRLWFWLWLRLPINVHRVRNSSSSQDVSHSLIDSCFDSRKQISFSSMDTNENTSAAVGNNHDETSSVKEVSNGTASAGKEYSNKVRNGTNTIASKSYSNYTPKTTRKPVPSGPWGGHGGFAWDDGAYTGIRQIVLCCGSAVDSISFEYDKSGTSVWSKKHGGSEGTCHKIVFDYPREVLVSISGHFGPFYEGGPMVIRSLTFHTNQENYGPFGVQQGNYFQSPTVRCRVVGFHGRSGAFVDAIGIHTLFSLNSPFAKNVASKLVNGYISAVDDTVAALKDCHGRKWKPTPSLTWGGQGGNPWDDGIHCGVRQIVLRWADAVDSIKIEYCRDEGIFCGITHGGLGGGNCHTIRLNYPDEYLTSVSGYYGEFGHGTWKPVAIRSLTFQSNLHKYGPYGIQEGTYFSTPMKGYKILGFCGKAGWYLDAIGVHMLAEDHDLYDDEDSEVENAWKEFALDLIHHTVVMPRN